jgi:hypothetical protein
MVEEKFHAQSRKKGKKKSDETKTDTATTVQPPLAPPAPAGPALPSFVYFRKEFNFKGSVKTAQLVLAKDLPLAEGTIEIYVNGAFIDLTAPFDFKRVDSTLFKQIDTSRQAIYEITSNMQSGKNVIAAKIPGNIKADGLKLALYYAYNSAELNEQQVQKLVGIIRKRKKEAASQLKSPNASQVQDAGGGK